MPLKKTDKNIFQKSVGKIPSEIQIGTGVGILVILLISLAAAIYIASYENNLVIQEHQNSQYLEAIVNTMPNEDQSNNQEKDVVIQIDEPTEQWKTCRNEKAGYEVKYPSEWEIYIKDQSDKNLLLGDCKRADNDLIIGSIDPTEWRHGISISYEDLNRKGRGFRYQDSASLEEYLNAVGHDPIDRWFEVNGVSAAQIDNSLGQTILVYGNNRIFSIHFGKVIHEESIHDILSTFRFIK